MRRRTLIFIISLFILFYIGFFIFSVDRNIRNSEGLLINDVSRLNPTHVSKIVEGKEVEGIREVLEEAKERGLKVSIAGKRYSMGGHTFYKDALVLDMTSFNKILSIDLEEKVVTVQSGATWEDIINYVNPYNLSVKVMQGYNSFTVGGSISVNVHESDPNYGPLVETVKSFRLLLENGTIVNVSRNENPELFSLVVGGYGLFGVILDVDLTLEENKVYEKKSYSINYSDYPSLFKEVRRENDDLKIIYARLSIAKDGSLLRELVATTYTLANIADLANFTEGDYFELKPNRNVALKKFIFGLSRKYDFWKKLRWHLQKKYTGLEFPDLISRNNLLNSDPEFLEYYSSRNTDILQEYFVPVEKLPEFLDGLRNVIEENDINFLSVTIRYIPVNNETFLSYSDGEDKFGAVLYFNVGVDDDEQKKVGEWTRELIDLSLGMNGTYYLPYELYASQEQIRNAYPQFDGFCDAKRKYDPTEFFINQFYAKYCLGEEDENIF